MRRRGLGKGLGKGYKNLVTRDPFIHGLSAKGIKLSSRQMEMFKHITFDVDNKLKTKEMLWYRENKKDADKLIKQLRKANNVELNAKSKKKKMSELEKTFLSKEFEILTEQDIYAKGKKYIDFPDFYNEFSTAEFSTLSDLKFIYNETSNIWSIPRAKKRDDPSQDEIAYVMGQLDLTRKQAEDLVKKYLDTLEQLPSKKAKAVVGLLAKGKALDWKVHWERKRRDGTRERMMHVWSPSKQTIIYKDQLFIKDKWVTQR